MLHWSYSLLLGFKMSCMKKSVCTEPSVDIVDPKDEISSRCTVKVMGKQLVWLENEQTRALTENDLKLFASSRLWQWKNHPIMKSHLHSKTSYRPRFKPLGQNLIFVDSTEIKFWLLFRIRFTRCCPIPTIRIPLLFLSVFLNYFF